MLISLASPLRKGIAVAILGLLTASGAEAATVVFGYVPSGSFGAGIVSKDSLQLARDHAPPEDAATKYLASCSGGGYTSIWYKFTPTTIAGACGFATQAAADAAAKALCGSDCSQGDQGFDAAPVAAASCGTFAAPLSACPGAVSALRDEDRLFDFAEKNYPQLFSPAGTASQTLSGYYLRYYSATNTYLAVKDGAVWLAVDGKVSALGVLSSLLLLVK